MARSGRSKNRGEAWAQGGFWPKVKEIKRKGSVLFLVSNFKQILFKIKQFLNGFEN
jgi:hypothetical protein